MSRKQVDEGFAQATNENIPMVDVEMIHECYMNNPDFITSESTGQKNKRAMRADYASEAVGYVRLRREGARCIVKAKVTPEHRVRADAYNVEVLVNETSSAIVSCRCLDCAASEGGCKHALALLSFLLLKSCAPSVTQVECYWKQSSLANSVKYGEVVLATELGRGTSQVVTQTSSTALLDAYATLPGSSSLSLTLNPDKFTQRLSLHQLAIRFRETGVEINSTNFLAFVRGAIDEPVYRAAEMDSKDQSTSRVWYELRYGRITASYVYQTSSCKTSEGTLIEAIVGAYSFPETEAMERGKRLESKVLKKAVGKWSPSGLIISREIPCLAASPDGLLQDAVLEVKCPAKASTLKNYLTKSSTLQPKCMAQIQLQMKLAGKKKGLFIIADPDFEVNGKITKINVDYSPDFIDPIISDSLKFWDQHIFPKLVK